MKRLLMLVLTLSLTFGVVACHQEGPVEQAGEKLDKTGRSIGDAVNPPKGPAQSVGRSIDRTLNK